MFFYLLYNSTIIKSESKMQKNISTLIYGSIIYIILHSILHYKNNNDFLNNLQKYFWIIFSLDCVSVLFTHIANNDTIFLNNIEFNTKKSILTPTLKKPNIIPKGILKTKNNISSRNKNRKKSVVLNLPDKSMQPESDVNSEIGSTSCSEPDNCDLDEFEKLLKEN